MEIVYLGKQSVIGNMIYQEFVCVKIAKYYGMMNDGNLESKEGVTHIIDAFRTFHE